ncbi:hypothetical protein NHX12_013398 [Muraenolepis orangiensis]|uniref:TNFR-Cys domain-containing protein n=1 Tax=Muraenolepis orangiensis TaxID=630683 RepID=A0A9Q0I4X3_9TELE|nr:hypothetical protein NHX12_013398 [Muraenolepis orangiensis]
MIVSLLMGISLLAPRGCWSGPASRAQPVEEGCIEWTPRGQSDVCCDRCHPGNHMVQQCGLVAKDLCVPCEDDMFATDPTQTTCTRCKQCPGVLVLLEVCTRTRDAVCGCPTGLLCGDQGCSFCVEECGRGQEPSGRSCRKCPNGTFNDQIHQLNTKCKPWTTTKCTRTDEYLVDGDAVSDAKCSNKATDEPRTLMAVECSFHEPEQISLSDSEGSRQKLVV